MDAIQVLYEDNHLIAVNKPSGWLVQADQTGDDTMADWVKEYIKIRYNKPGAVFLGVIHRLDRPVSGVVVFARTSKALSRMNELFKKRAVEKTYLAITTSRPDPLEGQLKHFIAKDGSRNLAKAFDTLSNRAKEAGAKKSTLDYRLIGELDKRYLLEVKPHTGRPHQIRVQLQKLGCPILGDVKYGSPFETSDGTIFLHSLNLSFTHPVKKEPVSITAHPPSVSAWRQFEGLVDQR